MEKQGKVDILIVDDKRSNLLAMEALLEAPDRNILKAVSGNEALGLALNHDFALALLDIQMPGMDGLETARLMRQNSRTRHIPIIFVTAIHKDRHQVFEGYSAGAVDYIFKPFEPIILKSKVNVMLELYRQKKSMETINRQLKNIVRELELTNRKILGRHKAAVEAERLKVILQLAIDAAREMDRPLMQLLASVKALSIPSGDPELHSRAIGEVTEYGNRIFKIVKKIQAVHNSGMQAPDHPCEDETFGPPLALSTLDSLTQLHDRRSFNEIMETEISRARQYGHLLSVLMIDLDFFKRVNDRYGHLAGDKVLTQTAGIMLKLVRERDVVCRYGGEKFSLMLPGTPLGEAVLLAERIRKAIAGQRFAPGPESFGITVSIGVASYDPSQDLSHPGPVHEADLALDRAKTNGRNRVEPYGRGE